MEPPRRPHPRHDRGPSISVVIGGFSQDVTVYVIAAAFLGVYFALQSGTLESVVYDTVLEETGDSEAFERTIGQVRLVESIALVASALAGGLIAQFAPLRATYFADRAAAHHLRAPAPRFREPQLHKTEEREPCAHSSARPIGRSCPAASCGRSSP